MFMLRANDGLFVCVSPFVLYHPSFSVDMSVFQSFLYFFLFLGGGGGGVGPPAFRPLPLSLCLSVRLSYNLKFQSIKNVIKMRRVSVLSIDVSSLPGNGVSVRRMCVRCDELNVHFALGRLCK